MIRDNISAADFEKIVSVQIDNEQKKQFVNAVINTDKTENLLKIELIKIIEELVNAWDMFWYRNNRFWSWYRR